MDYYQRAEELEEIIGVLRKTILKDIPLANNVKAQLELRVDCAGMDEEELTETYGEEVADLVIQGEYYKAWKELERKNNESTCCV